MNLTEKNALYDFCRRVMGKDYYNLKSPGKEFVKTLYFIAKGHKRLVAGSGSRIPVPAV